VKGVLVDLDMDVMEGSLAAVWPVVMVVEAKAVVVEAEPVAVV
jgi:hypothetical protein